ncbi:MAG: precorrin-8X methylmutase [Deltaproteobacteria bacterium]|nr:precorrin-8X methylmutase [Deltaproteobacteria bacterium]
MKPKEIESLSFKIIDREAGDHGFSDSQWPIVKRMIHASADFEYMETVRFHPRAVESGINAIRQGKPILTDTRMAQAGIRKEAVHRFGGSVICLIDVQSVMKIAAKTGTTRAKVAVDEAIDHMEGSIYVVGNAPTALIRLVELAEQKRINPALIVGFPVGFVNAAESKAALMKLDIPYITNVGRKGGSSVAASVVNALLHMAAQT